MDLEQLRYIQSLMGNDFNLLKDTYIHDNSSRIEDMSAYIRSRDFKSLRHHAHSIKSSSANIGAVEVADLAEKIENAALDEKIHEMDDLYQSIMKEFENVKKILNN